MATSTRHLSVAYFPKIMTSLAEICEVMGVGEKTVKTWVKRGAPIAVEKSGDSNFHIRYSAEAATLQAWRVTH